MNIAIIAKGSVHDGLGHLFRSRTFAKHCKQEVNTSLFIIAEASLRNIFHSLEDITRFHETEDSLIQEIRIMQFDVVVFDILEVKESTLKCLKSISKKTASISPIFNFIDKIDYLFIRSNFRNSVDGVKIFGGLEYAIVNENCDLVPDKVYNRNLKKDFLPITISMGGVDAPNKTLKVVSGLITIKKPLTIWVALGEGYTHSYNDLVDATRNAYQHEIILAKSNRSTWDIMGNAVLAVLAGGLTTIESIIAGIPSINMFDKEEHQKLIAKELIDKKAILHTTLMNKSSIDIVKKLVSKYWDNRNSLLEARINSRGLVDKLGAKRVLDTLLREINSE